MSYYYLGASLPMLSLDTPPPMSVDAFLDECGRHLAPEDLRALREIIEGGDIPPRTAFTRRWREKETMIRVAAARARASAAGRETAPSTDGSQAVDSFVEQAVAGAFAKTDPRQRELALDELRWTLIEEAIGHDSFALSAILGYAMKLKLAERWTGMDHARGAEKLQQAVQAGSQVN